MEKITAERWRPVLGEEGRYEVSDHGRVRSLNRTVMQRHGIERRFRGQLLRPVARGNGHLWIYIPDRSRSVHSLVLEAFVGPRPEGMWGCHTDDDPANNHLANLRWDWPKANSDDMKRNNGGHYCRRKTHCPRNHPLKAPNLSPSHLRTGKRVCLACSRGQATIQHARKRGIQQSLQSAADEQYLKIVAEGQQREMDLLMSDLLSAAQRAVEQRNVGGTGALEEQFPDLAKALALLEDVTTSTFALAEDQETTRSQLVLGPSD